jgi:hypothetical protein
VFSPAFGRTGPFGVYFGNSRIPTSDDVRAQEIAVVGLSGYGGFGPGPGRAPSGPAPGAPPGFRLARDVSKPTYRLVVYSAPRILTVNTLVLRRLAFPRTSYVLVTQRRR